MTGIPDPGSTDAALEHRPPAAPFDAFRHTTPEGREYWSAREYMPLLGYEKWERFDDAIVRAKIAAHNSGYDVAQNFPGAGKVAASGPMAKDYHLSRYACYLVAMCSDSRKQPVAEALTYFAIKTREAEIAQPALTEDEIVHQALTISARRIEALTAKVAELTAPAAAWNELAEAAGDYSVSDSAKVLSRDPAIKTGERRLFQSMQAFGWLYRENGRWRAYQRHVDMGWLVEKVGRPYWHAGREEMVAGEPTVRITPKGLAQLHFCLGGTGQLALMAGA